MTANPERFLPLSYPPEWTLGRRHRVRCRKSTAHLTYSKGILFPDNRLTLMDTLDRSSRVHASAPSLSIPETAETVTAYPPVSLQGWIAPPKKYRRPYHLLKYRSPHLCPFENEGSPSPFRPSRGISGIRFPGCHKNGAPAVITQNFISASHRKDPVAFPTPSAPMLLLPCAQIRLLKLTRSLRARNSSLLIWGPVGQPAHPLCPEATPHLYVHSHRGGVT